MIEKMLWTHLRFCSVLFLISLFYLRTSKDLGVGGCCWSLNEKLYRQHNRNWVLNKNKNRNYFKLMLLHKFWWYFLVQRIFKRKQAITHSKTCQRISKSRGIIMRMTWEVNPQKIVSIRGKSSPADLAPRPAGLCFSPIGPFFLQCASHVA